MPSASANQIKAGLGRNDRNNHNNFEFSELRNRARLLQLLEHAGPYSSMRCGYWNARLFIHSGAMITRIARRAQATFSSFWMQRTTGGIGVSGKLVFQLVTPTSPT
jgi:hypothetical protein